MKKIFILRKWAVRQMILLLLALVFSIPIIAGNEKDTIFYKEKGVLKPYVVKETRFILAKKFYTNLFLDYGISKLDKHNLFTGATHESAGDFPKLRRNSNSFSFYVMFGMRNSGFLSIMSGMGMDWVNYRFSQDVILKDIDGVATQVPQNSFFAVLEPSWNIIVMSCLYLITISTTLLL
jgi:hypothetical protein